MAEKARYACDDSYTDPNAISSFPGNQTGTSVDNSVVNLGISRTPCWFWFSVKNTSSKELKKTLYVTKSTGMATVWLQNTQQSWFSASPFDLERNRGYFSVVLEPGTTDFRIHMVPQSRMEAHLTLHDEGTRQKQLAFETAMFAMYYGATLFMALFYTVLYLGTRFRSYLYYVFSILAISLAQLSVDNLGARFFWQADISSAMTFIATVLNVLAGSLFLQSIFELKRRYPRLNRILVIHMWIAAFSLLLLFTGDNPLFVRVSVGFIFSTIVLLLSITGVNLVHKTRSAYFLFPAWLIYLAGVLLLGLAVAGRPVFDLSLEHYGYLYKAASMIEILLLAAALADRISQIQNEAIANKQKLLNASLSHETKLEKRVSEKTRELNQTLDELSLANKTKDTFFSIIAHDLKAPVGSVSRVLEEAAEGNLTLTDHMLEKLSESSAKVYDLLDNLLVWARSQQGQLTMNPESVAVSQYVDAVFSLFQQVAMDKNISLEKELQPDLTIFADYDAIFTIFRNLISNAIKFTPAGGKVTIRAKKAGEKIEIEIADSGLGMSDAKLSRLFQIGEGGIGITSLGTNSESGNGMGLILVREFAQAANTEIKVESKENEGTTFQLKIPAMGLMDDVSGLPCVLLAEDDVNIRLEQMAVMDAVGVRVDPAVNGVEVVEKIASMKKYDIVLLDLVMPGLSGVDAAQAIREMLPADQQPKIVFLSSFTDKQLKETVGDATYDGVLSADFSESDFTEILNNLNISKQ